MKLKFSSRRLSLVAVLAVITLLAFTSWLPTSNAASTGQGKGGEVIAKPTPTPKKTTTTKKNPPARTTSNSKTSRPAKTPSDSATAAEIIFWNTIKDSTNPDDFKAYLKKYPNGEFADLARNRLNALETAAKEEAARKEEAKRKEEEAKKRPGAVVKNSIGMELVYVPAGNFMMGSTKGGADEKAVHQVTISRAFYMGKYEVTQAQWQLVMGNNPSYFKDCGGSCPVEKVSWNDAQDFVNKLNEANDGFKYRLPSEAEWEYACRAGTTGDYYAADVHDIGWYDGNSGKKTRTVGGKQPNAFGLYDMSGNVWEWCRDWYHPNYDGAPTDGSAWLSGGEMKYRVLRGGSWLNFATSLRSAIRYDKSPDNWDSLFGFRVVAVARTR